MPQGRTRARRGAEPPQGGARGSKASRFGALGPMPSCGSGGGSHGPSPSGRRRAGAAMAATAATAVMGRRVVVVCCCWGRASAGAAPGGRCGCGRRTPRAARGGGRGARGGGPLPAPVVPGGSVSEWHFQAPDEAAERAAASEPAPAAGLRGARPRRRATPAADAGRGTRPVRARGDCGAGDVRPNRGGRRLPAGGEELQASDRGVGGLGSSRVLCAGTKRHRVAGGGGGAGPKQVSEEA